MKIREEYGYPTDIAHVIIDCLLLTTCAYCCVTQQTNTEIKDLVKPKAETNGAPEQQNIGSAV